jgi:uncharacterized membrane protein
LKTLGPPEPTKSKNIVSRTGFMTVAIMPLENDKIAGDKSHDDDHKVRTLQHGTSTVSISVLNLSKTIVGNGVLALPSAVAAFADDKFAVVCATCIVLVLASAAAYTFYSIGSVCASNDVGTFTSAWKKSTNKISSRTIAVVVTANTFLSCLASSIIIGQFKSPGKDFPADNRVTV